MLENITKKLETLFRKLRGRGLLTEQNIEEALREVRIALLESDVHYKVAKTFCDTVREKAIGKTVLESITPGQQVVKVVHEALTDLMGSQEKGIPLASKPPTVVMLVGLQGSGKTTTAGKLGRYFQKRKRRVLLLAADLQRPAAIDQLEILGKEIAIPVFSSKVSKDASSVVQDGIEYGMKHCFDVVIIDTAGRTEVNQDLMDELVEMKNRVSPNEVLFIADAMTGQAAVNVAQTFHQRMGISGVILTKTEGDARGGAILSIRAVTGAPIRFIGTGEKTDALELFYPERMASRILGMGDVLSLVELAEENVHKEQAANLEKKLQKENFTLEDFSLQLKQLNKMGGAGKIMEMIPGMNRIKTLPDPEKVKKEMKSVEAIISSMTIAERKAPGIINGNRRKRISNGSGTSVQEINRLLKQFHQAKKMMKRMSSGKRRGMGGLPIPF